MLMPDTGVERKESSYPHFTKEEAGAQSGEGTEYHLGLLVAELKSPVPGSLGVY